METVSMAVLGATAGGIGAALARPRDAVLIEAGIQLAPEYIAALNLRPFQRPAVNGRAAELYARCLEAGWMDGAGRPHIFPVASLLAQWLLHSGVDVRLSTVVTAIVRVRDGWHLTLLDADGFHSLLAKKLLDTREQPGGQPWLCAMLAGRGDAPRLPAKSPVRLLQGALPCEYAICLPCDGDYPQARAELRDFWNANRPQGWAIASVAPCFAYTYDAPVPNTGADGRTLCVSSAFGDLISALEGGIACACKHA